MLFGDGEGNVAFPYFTDPPDLMKNSFLVMHDIDFDSHRLWPARLVS